MMAVLPVRVLIDDPKCEVIVTSRQIGASRRFPPCFPLSATISLP